jgi:hypothetical protein
LENVRAESIIKKRITSGWYSSTPDPMVDHNTFSDIDRKHNEFRLSGGIPSSVGRKAGATKKR